MRTRIPLLLSLAAGLGLFLSAGCAHNSSGGEFTREIDKVRRGMSEADVRSALGKPDRTFTGVMTGIPPTDPGAPAPMPTIGEVPVGSRYLDWYYHRGDTNYHVLFGPSPTQVGRWQVVRTVAAPAGASVAG